MSKTRGQGEEGACCFCENPCGYTCIETTHDDCVKVQGGFYQGDGTECSDDDGAICEDNPANCEPCDVPDCLDDEGCPAGHHCVDAICVPEHEEIRGCNSLDQPNCPQVVHVKRPYANGLPLELGWGLAINFLFCDETEIEEDNAGVVKMRLAMDSYKDIEIDGEAHVKPTGIYNSGCCCNLYLNLHSCSGGGTCCIPIDNCAGGRVPLFDPLNQILIVTGKHNTPAEGYCAFSNPPSAPDPCNVNTSATGTISGCCCFGNAQQGSCLDTNCCTAHSFCGNGQVVFSDIIIDVQTFNPNWLNDPDGLVANRYCLNACESCWAVGSPCNNCVGHTHEGTGGHCITPFSCDLGDPRTYMKVGNTGGFQCNPDTDVYGEGECLHRTSILTGKQVSQWDFYYYMTGCLSSFQVPEYSDWCDGESVTYSMAPCDMCVYETWTNCSCGDPFGVGCPPMLYAQKRAAGTTPAHQYFNESSPYDIQGCYTLDNTTVFTKGISDTWRHLDNGCSADVPYTGCEMWNLPYSDNCDCQAFSPPCTPGLLPDGSTPSGTMDFSHPSLYPSRIETSIEIDTKSMGIVGIKNKIDIAFDTPTVVGVDSLGVIDHHSIEGKALMRSYRERSPMIFSPTKHDDLRPINDFARNGAVAEDGVPEVDDAIFLGEYSDEGANWSAWLSTTPCYAQTVESLNGRYLNFAYTVFAYCNSECSRMSKLLLPEHGVSFHITNPVVGILGEAQG